MTTRDGIGPDGLTDLERAAGRRPVKRLTDEQMTANLRAAVADHTPYADRQQAELRQPLTEAELKAGGGWHPAITDVDMTPRPRYRESQAAFEARLTAMGSDLAAVRAEVKQRNRNAALRVVLRSGAIERWESVASAIEAGRVVIAAYFTQCGCGFCGLRVEDPELARREYDAHVCAAAGVGQAAVDRAIAETDRTTMVKRTQHVLQPSIGEQVDEIMATLDKHQVHGAEVADDFEQRVKLLEHK